MSITELEQARHALERGQILLTLKEEYSKRMTSIANLLGALSLLGHSMTVDGLSFSLTFLADLGYVRIWRADEIPGWNRERVHRSRPDAIVFAKLQPKGLQLIDGQIDADPMVSFV